MKDQVCKTTALNPPDTGQGLLSFHRSCPVAAYSLPLGLYPMAWAMYLSSSACIISSRFLCTTFSVSTARALDQYATPPGIGVGKAG